MFINDKELGVLLSWQVIDRLTGFPFDEMLIGGRECSDLILHPTTERSFSSDRLHPFPNNSACAGLIKILLHKSNNRLLKAMKEMTVLAEDGDRRLGFGIRWQRRQ